MEFEDLLKKYFFFLRQFANFIFLLNLNNLMESDIHP
jgi:hypothetical protein